MTPRGTLALLVLLLSSAAPAFAADSSVEIDRSVLEDLKGYQPPPMFGAAAKAKPIATPPESAVMAKNPIPAPASVSVPKADALLNFPVKNDEIVTRQRNDAPDEIIMAARPDYSDSHTVLHMTPPAPSKSATAPGKEKKAAKEKQKAQKASVQLASATPGDLRKAASEARNDMTSSRGEDAAGSAADPARYVPKTKPTMPAIPSAKVEKASLDGYALPLNDKQSGNVAKPAQPTVNERIIDQALAGKMAPVDKKDIESTVSGGAVSSGIKTEPLVTASLPPGSTALAKVEKIGLEFKPSLTDLQADQQTVLKTDILPFLKKNEAARLQILSFASATGTSSDARRLSLSRALSVRSYLLEQGIDPSRMDVRAMGSNTAETPVDRVDLVFLN